MNLIKRQGSGYEIAHNGSSTTGTYDRKNQMNIMNPTHKHVFLMAEDNPADEALVQELLSQAFGDKYQIVCVDRFEKIANALSQGKFEILILDLGLPDRSGVNNVAELGKQYPELPIVVLTGQDDLSTAVESLQYGAQDYLSKNKITSEMLSRSLHYARERKKIEGQLRQALEESAYRNTQLESQAKHDGLTGLPNRIYLYEAGNRSLFRAKRQKMDLALFFFDLDGFKKINDSYGHLVGDELLKQVAGRIQNEIRSSDLLVRLGGDEFVILTDVLHQRQEVYPLAQRVLQAFSQPFHIQNFDIPMSPSIGVSFYPESDTLELLLKNADCAMYEAKGNAEENICFFSDEVADHFSRVNQIEQLIGSALKNGEFSVVFQPLLNMKSALISLEALVRWTSPQLGIVPPDEFIPIAEHSPAINDITKFVVKESAKFLESINSGGFCIDEIAINVCASQLEHSSFGDLFLYWLQKYKLPANQVCLELTERQMLRQTEVCKALFLDYQKRGINIALDDFGTGFSSVTHLIGLEIDTLKVDRILISEIHKRPRHLALVAGIVEMAHHINMRVVAEGIETQEEYEAVKKLGVDKIQGYHFSKPLTFQQCLEFLNNHYDGE